MRRNLALMAVAMGAVGAALWAPDAKACGGCFGPPTPPGQDVEVVTDHRMILSVSPQQTTLYDEIEYSGSPASFAWVLPINGQVTVGLSSDSLFKTLDTLTETTVESPPTDCPGLPASCQTEEPGSDFGGAGTAASADAGSAVNVLSTQVVGPYETVQLQSTDPTALEDWLTSHGYDIPADIEPVISAYVAQSFDFLAMKLVPGAGVQSMRPVRVTTPGATIALPLRMVAAGTGATVGITLWMLGDGRYEPSNFSYFHIDDADIAWDWSTQSSNYTTLRQQHETSVNGAGWEIESSTEQSQSQITSYLSSLERSFTFSSPDGGSDYAPETASDGGVSGTADQAQMDDLTALFSGIGVSSGQVRITRIRSDLAHTALGSDLQLTASSDQSELPNVRQPGIQIGQPQCPVYDSQCNYIGQEPRDQAIASMAGLSSAGGGGCATAPDGGESGAAWLTIAALGGLVLSGLRRRRRA